MTKREIAKEKLARVRAARIHAAMQKDPAWEQQLAAESHEAWTELERIKREES
jgi:hypothetical protein